MVCPAHDWTTNEPEAVWRQALIDAKRHPEACEYEEPHANLSVLAHGSCWTDGLTQAAEETKPVPDVHITPRHVFNRCANYLYDHPYQVGSQHPEGPHEKRNEIGACPC
jgi:hypothetical protein